MALQNKLCGCACVHAVRSSAGQLFSRLPGPLSEHSFVDFDVSPPPLSLYPLIYAFGSLLFFLYLALVRLALAVITVLFRVLLWLGAVLLCRRRTAQAQPSPAARDTGGDGQSVSTEAREEAQNQRRRLDALGVVYLVLLAVSAGLTLTLHSFLGLLLTTLVLGFSTAWQNARAKVRCRCAVIVSSSSYAPTLMIAVTAWANDVVSLHTLQSSGTLPTRAQRFERDALFSYHTMILVACLAALSAMAPLFVSWYAIARTHAHHHAPQRGDNVNVCVCVRARTQGQVVAVGAGVAC
jgi:hypothetical protein